MTDLPNDIHNFILSTIIGEKNPVFIRLDKDGLVQEWGGDLDHYNFPELKKGVLVDDQIVMAGHVDAYGIASLVTEKLS